MTPPASVPDETAGHIAVDVEVLIVGAGVTGIYQLYRTLESGFSALLLEAGAGVGGTWYWNRYPGARFDSESYTYGYLFSKELFEEWQWQEHFAEQPETERYFNHVVDRFGLRQHMQFGALVTEARYDEVHGTWTVRTSQGTTLRARYLIAATGILSVPYYPDVPGRDDFGGESYHTGRWPTTPVDFCGKRVAVVGTGSSGVQVIPAIVDDVASLTIYQRTPNWCTPLNNAAITPEEQAQLVADFEAMRAVLNKSMHGFLHRRHNRTTFDDSEADRQAFFEEMWKSPGFAKLNSNYTDMLTEETANAAWSAFIAEKVREIIHNPAIAEKVIPKDHRYAEKRPPFVTGYYEVFNNPKVSLVDLKEFPIISVTSTGIETSDRLREFDIIVWATGFDFGTGALTRMGIHGQGGLALSDDWADGPKTFLGVQSAGFPNLFFPGGPHAAAGNNPRYNGDQVDFIMKVLQHARESGFDVVEVRRHAEEEWTDMIDSGASMSPFGESSYFFGTNIPGKPRKYLLNSGGRPKLFAVIAEVIASDFEPFSLSRASQPAEALEG